MAYEDGPFLTAASFCDQVIEDKTGVLSLIRMIDRVNITMQGPQPPDELPTVTLNLTLALMFKSGKAEGRSELEIKVEKPSGLIEPISSMSIHFQGGAMANNVISSIPYKPEQEGVHWFHISLGDGKISHLITKVPLNIRYSRIVVGSSSPPQAE